MGCCAGVSRQEFPPRRIPWLPLLRVHFRAIWQRQLGENSGAEIGFTSSVDAFNGLPAWRIYRLFFRAASQKVMLLLESMPSGSRALPLKSPPTGARERCKAAQHHGQFSIEPFAKTVARNAQASNVLPTGRGDVLCGAPPPPPSRNNARRSPPRCCNRFGGPPKRRKTHQDLGEKMPCSEVANTVETSKMWAVSPS